MSANILQKAYYGRGMKSWRNNSIRTEKYVSMSWLTWRGEHNKSYRYSFLLHCSNANLRKKRGGRNPTQLSSPDLHFNCWLERGIVQSIFFNMYGMKKKLITIHINKSPEPLWLVQHIRPSFSMKYVDFILNQVEFEGNCGLLIWKKKRIAPVREDLTHVYNPVNICLFQS